jgi:pyruvate/2-oxoglutarate dehydrogenase complex dihydrolipoamide dehydrogenase (E3) component
MPRRAATPVEFDFVAIGGGSAGFNAARVAADLGARVAIVDGARAIGGLCILRGCMPSKTLLHAAEVLHHATHSTRQGVRVRGARLDLSALQKWKRHVIGDFVRYREQAMLNPKRFTLIRSHAHFTDPHTLELASGERVRGQHFILGTGSVVASPSIPGLAAAPQWTSDDVLDLTAAPLSVLVLGGGIVACELAQYLNRAGSRVILIQRSSHILSDHSPEAAAVVMDAFRAEGIELHAGTRLLNVAHDARGVGVRFSTADGQVHTRRAAHLFNALGRSPNTAHLGLAAAGVRLAPDGRVAVNRWQQTSAPHIYAGGDVCGPHDVVHLAVAQGELAARHALSAPTLKKSLRPVASIPLVNVVFTDPGLATAGATEASLCATRTPYLAASHPFNDHGKSIVMGITRGHVKLLCAPRTGRLLGAEVVGPQAGELIHCLTAPLSLRATVRDLLRAPWYHPTLAEIFTWPLEELSEKLSAR